MPSKLTKAARGHECTVRLYPYCNGNVETTVLAHAPSQDKGMGIKSPDWWGAFACSDCHDIVDGRKQVSDIDNDEIYLRHIEGVFLTNKIFRSMGLVK
jgi:hypothetical protein